MPEDDKGKPVEAGTAGFTEWLDKRKGALPEDVTRALLYMLEDLNGMMSSVARAKQEWEETVDSITDPLFMHDREFRIVKCNRAYRALAGCATFKELIGRPYYEAFPRMDGPFRACLKSVEEDDEVSVPSINRVFNVRFYPIRNTSDGRVYSVHVMEDVTEAKRAEESLMESEERFRAVAASAQDGIILIDDNGLISYWNDASVRIFGHSAAEALGKDAHLFIAPERYHAAYRDGSRAFSATGLGPVIGKTIELMAVRKGGAEFPVELSVSAVRLKGGWNAVGVLRDITERKRAQEELTREMEVTRHLLMIAEATSRMTDPDGFMASAVACVRRIMGCEICLSYLWDGSARLFRPCAEAGLGQGLAPFFRSEAMPENAPFIETAFVEGPAWRMAEETRPSGTPGRGLSWLLKDDAGVAVIPLSGRDRRLGLILCIYGGAGAPVGRSVERDTALVRGIAGQVSVGLENAIIYRDSVDKAIDLSRKMETIRVMHEIDRSILSTLDPRGIVETVVMMVSRLIACDRVTIGLVDHEKKGFYYAAGFGASAAKKGAFVPFEETSAAEVVKTGRPQYVADLAIEVAEGLLPLEKALLAEGYVCHLRVPLDVKGVCTGILSIGVKRPSAFTPDDLSTIEKLAAQVGVALENSRLVQDVEDLFISTIRVLSNTIDAKSPWTNGHSERVTRTAVRMAREMGFDEKGLRRLEIAGLLHDIGKIGTYETILDKPGRLTDEELAVIRRHPVKGAEILDPITQLRDVIPAIRHHHESYDGSGYPEGLKGADIPLMARILAVADAADAMGAERPYRKGRPIDEIVAELKRCRGTQFDPSAVDAFLRVQAA
jgi:PAS domain S-box-containing protein/putative nucleotidyltransferase with HDIG domain